jgi:hypothetical protein
MLEHSAPCFKQLTPPILSLKKTCFWLRLIYLRSISLSVFFSVSPSVSFTPFYSSTGEVLETLKVCRMATDNTVRIDRHAVRDLVQLCACAKVLLVSSND